MFAPGASDIHGIGLFSTEPIGIDTLVGSFEGFVTFDVDDMHVITITTEDGNWFGIQVMNDLKYLNHSTTPNVEVYGIDIYAIRDIEPGEELTFDYGWDDEDEDA